MKKKYLICGPLVPEYIENCFVDFSPAAGKFVRNLENALIKNGREVIGFAYITNAIVKEKEYMLQNNNIPAQYHIYEATNKLAFFKFQNELVEYVDKDTVVILYNMGYPYFSLIDKVKRKGGSACVLIADYSEISEMQSLPRKVHAWICQREFKKYDYAIVLAHNLEKKLNKNCRTLFVPGGIDLEKFRLMRAPDKRDKLVYMYAGLLSTVTGVDILLKAIELCENNDIEFWFSGKGDLEKQVVESAKRDSRVKYLGFLSEAEYFPTLEKVNVFINPRNMQLPQNQNNFPSKVLEYLATGRVVISTKFSEYKYFTNNFTLYDGTQVELSNTIQNVYENYNAIYGDVFNSNRKTAEEYSWVGQARRIVNMFENGEDIK